MRRNYLLHYSVLDCAASNAAVQGGERRTLLSGDAIHALLGALSQQVSLTQRGTNMNANDPSGTIYYLCPVCRKALLHAPFQLLIFCHCRLYAFQDTRETSEVATTHYLQVWRTRSPYPPPPPSTLPHFWAWHLPRCSAHFTLCYPRSRFFFTPVRTHLPDCPLDTWQTPCTTR